MAPDRATDVLGFGPAGAVASVVMTWTCASSGRLIGVRSLRLREQRVELRLVGMVAEEFVELRTGLHGVEGSLLRAVAAQRAIDVECCVVHRPERRQRVERDRYARAFELGQREQRSLAEFGDVGEH